MKPNALITLVIAGLAGASAMFAASSPAGADELSDLRANQAVINSRIDQLAKPAGPQTGSQPPPDNPMPADTNPPAHGSFPRSFLIPGTNTSVRISGFVDETMRYR
jgi:hypothetical protein